MSLELCFCLTSLGFAVLWAATGAVLFWGCRPPRQGWRQLPRDRTAGAVLAAGVLAWCAWFAQPMLEGGLATWRPALWSAVPVFTVLSFFFLDFLAARAWSGLMALMAIELLHLGFAVSTPLRPLFSAILYLAALAALTGVTLPWQVRDLLERCAERPAWRRGAALAAALLAAFFLAYAVLG